MINRDINNKMLLYYVLGLYYTSLELIKKNLKSKDNSLLKKKRVSDVRNKIIFVLYQKNDFDIKN